MLYRHFRSMPQAYDFEPSADGRVNIWLCRQVDTYITPDGLREYDVDVRVVCGIKATPTLEESVRRHWETWWSIAERR